MVADRPQGAPDRAEDGASTRWRSLDLTGNVRLLSADDLDDGAVDLDDGAVDLDDGPVDLDDGPVDLDDGRAKATGSPEAQSSAELNGEAAAPAVPPEATLSADPADEAAGLPLAGYDSLTLPSIRARLRSLDADQLRVLVAYERTHEERSDVLGMLERRIERLETGR